MDGKGGMQQRGRPDRRWGQLLRNPLTDLPVCNGNHERNVILSREPVYASVDGVSHEGLSVQGFVVVNETSEIPGRI